MLEINEKLTDGKLTEKQVGSGVVGYYCSVFGYFGLSLTNQKQIQMTIC